MLSAIGCEALQAPKHAWIRQNHDEATVGCDDEDKAWKLKCDGSKWIGHMGNCTQGKLHILTLCLNYHVVQQARKIQWTANCEIIIMISYKHIKTSTQ